MDTDRTVIRGGQSETVSRAYQGLLGRSLLIQALPVLAKALVIVATVPNHNGTY